jgi:hypothetical protein
MKLTPLLIPLLLFMTSCTIDWNDEKDAKIAELEKQVTEMKEKNEDDLFKKKQECLKLFQDSYWVWIYQEYKEVKTDIFYSNTINNCVLVLEGWSIKNNNRVFSIFDMLSRKTLFWMSVDANWKIVTPKYLTKNIDELKCEFNNELSALKWTIVTYFEENCIVNNPYAD